MALGKTNFQTPNDANLVAGNIKNGVAILGVTGNYAPAITWGTEQEGTYGNRKFGYYLSSDGKMAVLTGIYYTGEGNFRHALCADASARGAIATALSKTLSSYKDMIYFTSCTYTYSYGSPNFVDNSSTTYSGPIVNLLIFS